MTDEMIRRVEAAIDASTRWHESGWTATFGLRSVEVKNLKSAEALPKTEVCRDEAVNYWLQVRLAGADTAGWGRKALEALKRGDLMAAEDALYFCRHIEIPFHAQASTWQSLYEAFMASKAA